MRVHAGLACTPARECAGCAARCMLVSRRDDAELPHLLQVEDETYQLRPMNCPFHVLTYKQGYHSYRDLPLRWAELGTVYRYERSGTMHGLFRVRGFTQARGPLALDEWAA
jgi:threonyl-tRNA synthetase